MTKGMTNAPEPGENEDDFASGGKALGPGKGVEAGSDFRRRERRWHSGCWGDGVMEVEQVKGRQSSV